MMQSLLERFGITVPRDFDEYNLIGVDFGDGEFSAALAQWVRKEKRVVIRDLVVDEGGTLRKNQNAFWVSDKEQRFVYDARESELTKKDGGLRYYNFKKCPGTPESRSSYVRDDGSLDARSYEEVMALGFAIAIRTLFRFNPLLIDREKPTILLVGRPSSPGWAKCEKEYARLLEHGLQLEDLTTKPVHVAIQAESWAALAREIDPKWGKNRVKQGEVVVVLDNGSSTFDITVIGKRGLEEGGGGEDSFQFGGNQLDQNLLQLMWEQLKEKCPGQSPLSIHGHKLGIRIKKEDYYGLDGTLKEPVTYYISLEGSADEKGRLPRFAFRMDEEVMEKAAGEMPVTVFHFEQAFGSVIQKRPIKCDSWLEGCRVVYHAFYEKMQPMFLKAGDKMHPRIPDRVILSGGVSVMPEVQEIAKEVFGASPVLTDLPNYSVSQGLAYVLGCEIRKAGYMEELLLFLEELLPSGTSLRESIIRTGVDFYWNIYQQSLQDWASREEALSLQEWYQDFFQPLFDHDLGHCVQAGARKWYEANGIEARLNQALLEKFRQMFADYADDFQYQLPKLDFEALKGVVVRIVTVWSFFFGQMTAEEDPEALFTEEMKDKKRDQAWRQKACRGVLAMEHKVRYGGTNTCSYTYMRRTLFGMRKRKGHTDVSYQGLLAMFQREITGEVADGIRKEIFQLLEEKMREYVELITPYFNMTARL